MTPVRNLTLPEIEKILTKYPKARRIAVENFLFSVGANGNESNATANLKLDTRLYNWKADTVKAISEGIRLATKASHG